MSSRPTAASVQAALSERPVRHLINGQVESSDAHLSVVNPATGEVVARCPSASADQLERAVQAAARAQTAWAELTPAQRRAHLERFAAVLLAAEDELAGLITLEQGKPLRGAADEVRRSAQMMLQVATLDLGPELLREDERGRVEMHHRALGVVGIITPWNVPIGLAVPRLAHALYAGNSAILKPSPYTPLATLRMGELAADVFPPGVMNILAGDDAFGRGMTEHPGIAKISFTGSVPSGKKVMAAAAGSLKRVTLELGGNDAAIVLPDVDVAAVVPRLFGAAFVNSGQVCMSIKRLYVHEDVYEQVRDGLAELARNARVGDGFEEGVQYGPLQNRQQFDRVRSLLDDSRDRQASFPAGGGPIDRPGYFIAPTIVTGLQEGAPLVDEEPFGPVLPVMPYRDVDDAIRRANDSSFGLCASIWSSDIGQAALLAPRLAVGTTWINHHVGADPLIPFGGAKESGIGREFGLDGVRGYMESAVVFVPAAKQ